MFGIVGVVVGVLLCQALRTRSTRQPRKVKPKTAKHLDKIEAVIKRARSVFIKYPYTDTLRNIVAIGLIDQMIEHHEAMCC